MAVLAVTFLPTSQLSTKDINDHERVDPYAPAAVAALGAAVAIGGCSSSTTHGGSGHDQMPAMPGMSASGSASPDAAASYNTADITFATHMSPHHQQAV